MHKTIKNQAINKTSSGSTTSLINYLNRIITTQTHLFETEFSLESFINFALSQIMALTEATGAVVELKENDTTIYRYTSGNMKKYENMKFDVNDSIALLSMNTHQIIQSSETQTDDRLNATSLERIGSPLTLITAPLFHEGKTVGALTIFGKADGFDDIGIQTARIISGLISFAISQHHYKETTFHLRAQHTHILNNLEKAEEELHQRMHHDYLTGLPNRQLFNEELAITIKKAKRKKQLVALLYMNIDHFQRINESVGHAIGDKILTAFSLRLKQCVRGSDIVARLNGDEFVLLVDDIKDAQDAIVIVNKIMDTMRKPFNFNKLISLTISVGVSFLSDFNITPDEFIKQADQALYISKNSGRNTFYIFNSELQNEAG